LINRKDESASLKIKKTKKFAQSSLLVRVYYPKASQKSDRITSGPEGWNDIKSLLQKSGVKSNPEANK
jgi:hypothetical protein